MPSYVRPGIRKCAKNRALSCPLVGYRAGDLKTDNVGKCLQFAVDDCKLTSWIVAAIQYLIRPTGGPKVRCFVRGVNEMNKLAQSSIEPV